MEDRQIIHLFNRRKEAAIGETKAKYGQRLFVIAFNILQIMEDAEEVEADTYGKAWNTIPPQQPQSLFAYLGRIARNLAINRWHASRAQKRYAGADVLLSELHDCIPAPETVENTAESKEIAQTIDAWLAKLPKDDRILFLRRY